MGGTDRSAEPLVTAIVPTYGRGASLRDAVESVLDQTYPDLELVVVDDGSPEPVAPSIEDLTADAAVDVTCLRHEENRGANAARNTGIRAAEGRYLAFLDDDDRWVPESVERRVERFAEHSPDVGVVYSNARTVDADGRVVHETDATARGDVTRALLGGAIVGSFSRVMVSRTVADRAGPLDERFPSWQDWEWYIRLSRHCRFELDPAPLAVRRVAHERITDDHERKRDVSYPLMLEKHRSTAAEYGRLTERRFVGACSRSLAASALHNGYWADAVRYALRAARSYPLSPSTLLYLVLALGGPGTLESARRMRRWVAGPGRRS